MSDMLARRYEQLLRFYPAAYRRERGDELLDTLMESAGEDQVDPPRREVVALVLGGLRARAGRDRRETVRLSWLAGVRAAVLMLLVAGIARPGFWMISDAVAGVPGFWPWQELVPLTVGVIALILTLLGRYGWGIAAALVAFGLAQVVTWGSTIPNMWELPLAVVLMVPLVRHAPGRVSGLLRWSPIVPLVLIASEWLSPMIWAEHSGLLQRAIHMAVVAGALVWLAIDERVAMALGFLLLYTVLVHIGYQVVGPQAMDVGLAIVSVLVTVLPPALLLLGAGLRSRHTAGL